MSSRPRNCALFGAVLAAFGLWAAPAGAGTYLLVDAQTGAVLAQSDAGRPWYPASVTKLMTAYLTFHALRSGKVQADTLLTVSNYAASQPPSKIGFKAGTKVTVDNALKMLMVKSANDIAVVLAEGIAENVPAFVEVMNATANKLGMTGTRFANPNGLPDESQVTTARDMALLARAILREFPEYELYFRIPAIRLGKRIMRNHNRLIDRYPGADGMKTGFICSSGFNVVATAKRGDRRLIAVVFGSYSAQQRAEDAARLFERGFDNLALVKALFSSGPQTLDLIENVRVDPADLREDMCNRKRKRPAAESDIEEDDEDETEGTAAGDKKSKGRTTLLVDLPPSMPPIQVYAGAPPKPAASSIRVAENLKNTVKTRAAETTGKQAAGVATAFVGSAQAAPAAEPLAAQTGPAATSTDMKLPRHVPLPRRRPKL